MKAPVSGSCVACSATACLLTSSSRLAETRRNTLFSRESTSGASADLPMKSVAPASRARSLLPASSLPEITTTGSSRMRWSVALRMRLMSAKPVSFGMSRSVSTRQMAGSVSIAFQPSSPSGASRTANAERRIVEKVVRTNFESSTTSTHFCARSVDGGTDATPRGRPRCGG